MNIYSTISLFEAQFTLVSIQYNQSFISQPIERIEMTLKYLIVGATGGLGAHVLSYMVANLLSSEYAAASSQEPNRKRFEDQGISFRLVNYDEAATLNAAFEDVENLLFVSTNTFDVETRARQHWNFVDAAKKMGVQHVCVCLKCWMG